MRRCVAITLLVSCAACLGSPPEMPNVTGRGVTAFDAEAPAGAKTWERPQWRVGDKFVLRRGELVRGEFRVASIVDDAYVLDTGGGPQLRRTLDLGNLGEWTPSGEPMHVLAPADARYHWPLWVGKKWTCEFVDLTRGAQPVPMQANYVVEDLDTITVPAGTFEALRIVRSVRLAAVEGFLSKGQVWWYAPKVGTEIRQMNGDTITELVERVPAP